MLSISQSSGGVALGECVFMRDQAEPKLVLNGQTFLKSGNLIFDEKTNYPDAFAQFGYKADARPYNWFDANVSFLGPYSHELTYGNGVYILAAGYQPETIYRSTDLSGVTSITTIYQVVRIVFAFGLFVMLSREADGTSKLRTSPDGTVWTERTLPVTSTPYLYLTFTGSTLVLSINMYTAGVPNNLATSTDGITWTARSSSTLSVQAAALVGANGMALYSGYTASTFVMRIFTATTPYTAWTERTSLNALLGTSETIQSMAFGLNLYVVVTSLGKVITSPDLNTWTLRFTIPGGNTTSALLFVNNEFILASRSIYTSLDAITWTERKVAPSLPYNSLVFNGDKEIAALEWDYLSRVQYKDTIGIKAPIERGGSPLYMRIK